jgi:hypothetical protein
MTLVRLTNDYSVSTSYAHQPMTVVGGVDEVRLVCRDHAMLSIIVIGGREQTLSLVLSTTWHSWNASQSV